MISDNYIESFNIFIMILAVNRPPSLPKWRALAQGAAVASLMRSSLRCFLVVRHPNWGVHNRRRRRTRRERASSCAKPILRSFLYEADVGDPILVRRDATGTPSTRRRRLLRDVHPDSANAAPTHYRSLGIPPESDCSNSNSATTAPTKSSPPASRSIRTRQPGRALHRQVH